jgi:hypothetical protein
MKRSPKKLQITFFGKKIRPTGSWSWWRSWKSWMIFVPLLRIWYDDDTFSAGLEETRRQRGK